MGAISIMNCITDIMVHLITKLLKPYKGTRNILLAQFIAIRPITFIVQFLVIAIFKYTYYDLIYTLSYIVGLDGSVSYQLCQAF